MWLDLLNKDASVGNFIHFCSINLGFSCRGIHYIRFSCCVCLCNSISFVVMFLFYHVWSYPLSSRFHIVKDFQTHFVFVKDFRDQPGCMKDKNWYLGWIECNCLSGNNLKCDVVFFWEQVACDLRCFFHFLSHLVLGTYFCINKRLVVPIRFFSSSKRICKFFSLLLSNLITTNTHLLYVATFSFVILELISNPHTFTWFFLLPFEQDNLLF